MIDRNEKAHIHERGIMDVNNNVKENEKQQFGLDFSWKMICCIYMRIGKELERN